MVIGITGGVGSGKSTITGILREKYGYTALLTDDMAKELESPGHAVYEELLETFGEGILGEADQDGKRPIDKAAFASLIYSDEKAKEAAEEIIHPATWGWCEEIIAKEQKEHGREETRIAVESALPCERYRLMCDEIWFVYTDEAVRTARLMETRGYSPEKCREIMDGQISDEAFIGFADYIIDNSGDFSEAEARVEELMSGAGREESL